MSHSKHTPGPWSFSSDLNDKKQSIEASEFIHIALVDASIPNARLIAAAPEMLEALAAIVKAFHDDYDGNTISRPLNDALNRADNILLQARGEK